jgi:hypothetical protein
MRVTVGGFEMREMIEVQIGSDLVFYDGLTYKKINLTIYIYIYWFGSVFIGF